MSLRVLTNMKPKVSHMRNTKGKTDASATLLMAGRSFWGLFYRTFPGK
jgi:hypothetical protein